VQEGGMADVLVTPTGPGSRRISRSTDRRPVGAALCIAAVGRAPRGPRRSLQARRWLRWLIRRRSRSSGAA